MFADGFFGGGFATLLWLLQIGLIIHVIKTGRPFWWIWLLLMMPGLGLVAYFFVEVLPGLRMPDGPSARGWKPRSWRIAELRRMLDERPTVETRLLLAEELLKAGKKDEAHEVAQEAASGVFKNDPHTLAAVARFKAEVGRWSEVAEILPRIDLQADRMLARKVSMLEVRTAIATGQLTEAHRLLQKLEGDVAGEELRFREAELARAEGKPGEADKLWRDIRKKYRKGNRAWRGSEREWFEKSKERLKDLNVK